MYRKHEYRENFGFGKLITPELGFFSTYQFALFKVIFARLLTHPARTFNQSEADAFFVPYDVGFNGVTSKHTGRDISKVWQGCDFAYEARDLLDKALKESQLNGHDHFLVFDLSNAHYLMDPCYQFLSRCINCTVLGIETLLYPTPYTYWLKSEPRIFPTYQLAKRWQGVPFPASIHWHEGMRRDAPPWSMNKFQRKLLCVYWGNANLFRKGVAVKLRRAISAQLSASNVTDCKTQGSDANDRGKFSDADFMVYANATFCLHPAGDAETRKGIFDSLLLGCIPVVFSPEVLHRVYGWHFSREDGENVALYIPAEDVITHAVDIPTLLRNVSQYEVAKKQKAIERFAASIQYAFPPTNGTGVWSPPQPDAVDVILWRIERQIAHYKANGSISAEDKLSLKEFHKAIYGIQKH